MRRSLQQLQLCSFKSVFFFRVRYGFLFGLFRVKAAPDLFGKLISSGGKCIYIVFTSQRWIFVRFTALHLSDSFSYLLLFRKNSLGSAENCFSSLKVDFSWHTVVLKGPQHHKHMTIMHCCSWNYATTYKVVQMSLNICSRKIQQESQNIRYDRKILREDFTALWVFLLLNAGCSCSLLHDEEVWRWTDVGWWWGDMRESGGSRDSKLCSKVCFSTWDAELMSSRRDLCTRTLL